MGLVVIDDSALTSIADAIRDVSGSEDALYPSEMPNAVKAITDEASLVHWNAITDYGRRTYWDGTYGYTPFMYTDYSDVKFPKPVVITGKADRLFRVYNGSKLLRKEDVDMTGVTSVNAAFSYIYMKGTLGVIPDYGIPAMQSYQSTFNGTLVKKIELIRVMESTTFSDTFTGCSQTKEVYFDGPIGTSISFSSCPLTVECMKHIISQLVNYAGTENEFMHKVTFSSACLDALDAEGNTSPNGNTWRQYITDLGWNC